MDWNRDWDRSSALPRSQHWITAALRGVAAVAGVVGGVASIAAWAGGEGILALAPLAWGVGLLLGAWSLALVVDAQLFQARLHTDWSDRHLAAIREAEERRSAAAQAPAPDELDEEMTLARRKAEARW